MKSILVFGLGNPGREYTYTYHNAGLLALGHLHALLEEEGHSTIKSGKTFAYWKYGDLILATARPEAEIYMNQSGIPAEEALSFFKLPAEQLIVLHDDSDLPLGEFRLEKGRGAAGHHGVESIIAVLGTNDFLRGRIGIRPIQEPEGRRRKAEEFVLKTISSEDQASLEEVFQKLALKVRENV